jgi:DNA-binding LytR/AlgR family response regulator
MNETRKVTVRLSVEGEIFPIAYETDLPAETVITHIKQLGDCKEVSHRFKPVVIPCAKGVKHLRGEEVSYLEADGAYCHIHYCSGKTDFISEAMGTLVECLHEQGIMRCHKSFAVNIMEVDVIGGNFLILRDKTRISMSKMFRSTINFCYIHCGTKSRKYILP